MNTPFLTVILCTLNPPVERLGRVLRALAQQTLPTSAFEVLVIDNGSTPALAADLLDRSALAGRVVREDAPGLVAARRAGILAAAGEVLVFVDDDNVLAPGYLAEVVRLAEDWPHLGVWGGTCEGEFETPPASWVRPYLGYLAVRTVDRPVWGNLPDTRWAPFGAGLCLRTALARQYVTAAAHDPLVGRLGRTGMQMASGDDTDMVFFALGAGTGMGLFPSLHLWHLIPPGRLEIDYLERLLEGIARSAVLVEFRHGLPRPRLAGGRVNRWARAWASRQLDPRRRRLETALARGRAQGEADLAALVRQNPTASKGT